VAGNSRYPGRSVISKISAILLAIVAEGGLTLTEIGVRSAMPLSTVHRLANELADWQVLERDCDGVFRTSRSFRNPSFRCSMQVVEPTADDMRAWAAPAMEDLFRATGLPVRAGLLEGTEVAYLEKVDMARPVSRTVAAARLPPHATALGKALLAFSPASTVDGILRVPLRRYTATTQTDPQQIRLAFRSIRASRFAVSDRELDDTWCSIAAPVFGPAGRLLSALEVRVPDLTGGEAPARSALTVATRSLSRELSHWLPAQHPQKCRFNCQEMQVAAEEAYEVSIRARLA
jgi:DNA-binding IclR family transcriptional regulator